MYVYVTAKTKYGQVRLRITTKQWQAANTAKVSRSKARDHISIKVKERLNKAGAYVHWLKWEEISFAEISSQGCESAVLSSPLEAHDRAVRAIVSQLEATPPAEEDEIMSELFPGYTQPTPGYEPCGCVPSSVTRQ